MPIWPALLIAPLLALAEQAIAYALTPALCARQQGGWLHLVAALFLLASAVMTAIAAREAQQLAAGGEPGRVGDAQRLMLARAATGVGAIATIALVALWVPKWVLSPCLG